MTEYERQYHKWFKSLSPKKQAKLRAQGLDKPLDDHNQTNTPGNGDFAFATLGEDFDYEQFDEQPTLDETHVDEQAKAYGSLLLCWVFQRLQRNQTEKAYALDRDALFFALGLDGLLVHKTQSALARHYCVERATVSARVKAWKKTVGLKPSAFMKSESACNSYSAARMKFLTRRQ